MGADRERSRSRGRRDRDRRESDRGGRESDRTRDRRDDRDRRDRDRERERDRDRREPARTSARDEKKKSPTPVRRRSPPKASIPILTLGKKIPGMASIPTVGGLVTPQTQNQGSAHLLKQMQADQIRAQTHFECDDCGEVKEKSCFSNSQLYGPKNAGAMRYDPGRAIRCILCVEKRNLQLQNQHIGPKRQRGPLTDEQLDSMYCKICEVQLKSENAFRHHMNGSRHLKNVAWYKANPHEAVTAGIADHPELGEVAEIIGQMLIPAGSQPLMITQGTQPQPVKATAKAVGASGALIPVAEKSTQLIPRPQLNILAALTPAPPPPPPLTPSEIRAEQLAEKMAKRDLNSKLKELKLPTLDSDDNPVTCTFEDEGLPPDDVWWRCNADFAGGPDDDPPGLSVISEPRKTKEEAELQAFLQILRGIKEWYNPSDDEEEPPAPPPAAANGVGPPAVIPPAVGAKMPTPPMSMPSPPMTTPTPPKLPVPAPPPGRGFGMPPPAPPAGFGAPPPTPPTAGRGAYVGMPPPPPPLRSFGGGVPGAPTPTPTFVSVKCPGCKSQLELESIPRTLFQCPMCTLPFNVANQLGTALA
eukprot:TRINITY_DN12204_c0_g1_i1.p1 TRINITY_DN12204_c0_g1~~TRINITY_DN12204_c0_g1_i1.p1  ORF type:complete len:623 (+),score=161.44 TRINITY_DN12204_c0_g1_i1:109-1869(+)